MLFHSVATLACALNIVACAAASPTKRDVSVLIANILNNRTVNALDQHDDLIVRVNIDATKSFIGDVVDLLSQKRDDSSLVSIDVDVDDLLNNVSISVMSQ
ncbi:hypothetical protein BDR07DRAFT_1380715 [Suillus spraguei]|nr:hypothetical protein BDR07DRAFT_1380715 [Suillus spraguei]